MVKKQVSLTVSEDCYSIIEELPRKYNLSEMFEKMINNLWNNLMNEEKSE